MLEVNKLQLFFGDRAIANNITFSLHRKERVGLVGLNGAGKSTLLKLIAGELKADGGEASLEKGATLGYLHQDLNSLSGKSIREEVKEAMSELVALETEYARLEKEVAERTDYESDSYMQLLDHFDTVQSRYHYLSGDQLDKQIELITFGLGFKPDQLDRSINELSGGWKMRVELAKLLIQKPDLLLLDEPTNHLDIESIIWMESWLNRFEGGAIIISHDIQFLDNTTNRTLEIVNGKIKDYPFPYTKYKKVRAEELVTQQQAYENQQRAIKQKERTIERFRAKASKASIAQSMIKELEKMERIDTPEKESTHAMNIRFPSVRRSGAVVYDMTDLGHSYGDNHVFSGLDLKIERGARIAFVGQNGQGKTTLAKIIAGLLQPSEGEIKEGANVDLGYFAQNQAERLDPEKTVLQISELNATPETRSSVRSILGAFLFPGDEVEKKISVLSGGERARLAISLLLYQNYNVLLLDEPTNHLDIYSKEVLKEALKAYEGTLLVISHDREFLSGLTEHTLSFREGVIKYHLDDVDLYLKKNSFSDMRSVEEGGNQDLQKNKKDNPLSTLSYEERKQLKRQLDYVERDIEKFNAHKEGIELKMAQPEVMNSPEFSELSQEHASLLQKIQDKEKEWEQLVTQLDE